MEWLKRNLGSGAGSGTSARSPLLGTAGRKPGKRPAGAMSAAGGKKSTRSAGSSLNDDGARGGARTVELSLSVASEEKEDTPGNAKIHALRRATSGAIVPQRSSALDCAVSCFSVPDAMPKPSNKFLSNLLGFVLSVLALGVYLGGDWSEIGFWLVSIAFDMQNKLLGFDVPKLLTQIIFAYICGGADSLLGIATMGKPLDFKENIIEALGSYAKFFYSIATDYRFTLATLLSSFFMSIFVLAGSLSDWQGLLEAQEEKALGFMEGLFGDHTALHASLFVPGTAIMYLVPQYAWFTETPTQLVALFSAPANIRNAYLKELFKNPTFWITGMIGSFGRGFLSYFLVAYLADYLPDWANGRYFIPNDIARAVATSMGAFLLSLTGIFKRRISAEIYLTHTLQLDRAPDTVTIEVVRSTEFRSCKEALKDLVRPKMPSTGSISLDYFVFAIALLVLPNRMLSFTNQLLGKTYGKDFSMTEGNTSEIALKALALFLFLLLSLPYAANIVTNYAAAIAGMIREKSKGVAPQTAVIESSTTVMRKSLGVFSFFSETEDESAKDVYATAPTGLQDNLEQGGERAKTLSLKGHDELRSLLMFGPGKTGSLAEARLAKEAGEVAKGSERTPLLGSRRRPSSSSNT